LSNEYEIQPKERDQTITQRHERRSRYVFNTPTRRPGEQGVASQNGPGFASSKEKKEER
jgi:hypothetical protein